MVLLTAQLAFGVPHPFLGTKECELIRSETDLGNGMCLLEPECAPVCNTVQEEACADVPKQKCTAVNEPACSTVLEQQCGLVNENRCSVVNRQACSTVAGTLEDLIKVRRTFIYLGIFSVLDALIRYRTFNYFLDMSFQDI